MSCLTNLKTFCVVTFPSDRTVEVVPSTWISYDQRYCPFPSNRPKGFQKIQEIGDSVPDPVWPMWEVILVKSYNDFEKANVRALKELRGIQSDSTSDEALKNNFCELPISAINPDGSIQGEPSSCILNTVENHGDGHFVINVTGDQSREATESANVQGSLIETLSALKRELHNFQEACLQNQLVLHQEIQDLKLIVLRSLSNGEQDGKNEASSVHWPMKSEEEFVIVNQQLSKIETFNAQVTLLSRIGGTSVGKTVNNTLKFILDHKFALETRLTHASNKIEFGGSVCARLVRESVRKFYQLPANQRQEERINQQLTDDKLNSCVGKWLRDSVNRGLEGRLVRRKHGVATANEKPENSNQTSGDATENQDTGAEGDAT